MPETHEIKEANTYAGRPLVFGSASGQLVFSDTALSFWGGVDSQSGRVIDQHHPLVGCDLAEKILALPGGRGSCTGSSVIMELIMNRHAPAGIIVSRREEILSLGVIVADEVFGRSIPVVQVTETDFEKLRQVNEVSIDGGRIVVGKAKTGAYPTADLSTSPRDAEVSIVISDEDRRALEGEKGKAVQVAMRVTLRMAAIQGASELMDISQVHIDGCIYTGSTSLEFARRMRDWGGTVAVPTTLNAISVDQMRWREQGVSPDVAMPASELGEAYASMGTRKTFTCAPYQLSSAPAKGDQIVWAESNAVVYANSVIGARTTKYPDYLDLCIALTGRAPLTGAHISENRRASVVINVSGFSRVDDLVYPLLGYRIGMLVGDEIPVIVGLEEWAPSFDDLKAFGAGFATTSGSPMFHIVGVTPEATELKSAVGDVTATYEVCPEDLLMVLDELNSEAKEEVDLIAFGNPHFSFEECERLAALCRGYKKHPDISVIITCGRATFDRISATDARCELEAFGVQFVTDACWCTLAEPVIPKAVSTIMTNSAKYAHYGPGLTGKDLRLGSLSDCVHAARRGRTELNVPSWA